MIPDLHGQALIWAHADAGRQFDAHARRKDSPHKGELVTYLHMTRDSLTLALAAAFEAGANSALNDLPAGGASAPPHQPAPRAS